MMTRKVRFLDAVGGGQPDRVPMFDFVLASDHSLHDGIPIENIRALREAGLKYGTEAYRIQIRS